MNLEQLMTKSLRASPIGNRVGNIMLKALVAVDPAKAVEQFMHRDESRLLIGSHIYNIDKIERVFLIGFGKASVPMAEAAISIGRLAL